MDGSATGPEDKPLEHLLDDAEKSEQDGRVTIGSLLDNFGSRSFGPLIAVFALVAMTPPIGAIPGIPTAMGVLIFLVSVQWLFGREHPWVPARLQKVGFSRDKVTAAQDRAGGVLRRIDRLITRRLVWATGRRAEWVAALCCTLLALTMPPLELLPFAAAAPAAAVLLFGIGLTACDGLLILAGFGATAGVLVIAALNLPRLLG
ncbi:exopolysaccharide biosynthesis protein [Stakelama saccharophila]|uniref:Exopolysaccharide biosynthesis protein n=1 Tax=Stakelama saccharophila TaxID=3075605 RepID=A0ABZ0BAN6_9SPHN|nr:exopolysaccharide biosynthesis protein [Stakelama sp. W311]WNO54349.1 exopolysaccharide biosynthesis protein [Stakelama sp. W311]